MHLLIIGGSDAGISAALRARELSDSAELTVLLADAFPNYSICGLPFYLSGETPNWQDLAHRRTFEGIQVLTEHRATAIDPTTKTVIVDGSGTQRSFRYDRLLIATGARPVWPRVPGIDLDRVYPLHTMDDSFRVHHELEERNPRSVVIVGSGYIGLEMADALTRRGLHVMLIGRSKSVLPSVDGELGGLIEEQLRAHDVIICNHTELHGIEKHGSQLQVVASGGIRKSADFVLVATGVEPNTALGVAAGARTGIKGAFCINRRMETNLPFVFAAGDCVETWHRVMKAYTYLPLGTTAHKQGRVAGENAVGGAREFEGSVGTQVVKVFDLAIARTGLRDSEALRAGFNPSTVNTVVPDHKAYYPGAHPVRIHVTGDRSTGRLLGAQIVGHSQAEIAKRIDVFATALFHGMTVEALNNLDLSYTPPFSSPWDPVQMAGQSWTRGAPGATTFVPKASESQQNGGST